MLIYILMLLIAIALNFKANKKTQSLFAFFILLMMMLVCGFRDISVGVDTSEYIRIFNGKVYTTTGEIAFYATINLFKYFSTNEHYWLIFTSILIYLPLFFCINKESPLPAFSMLIFMISTSAFFPESMNTIRQSISASFILLSFCSWSKNKRFPTFLYILTAVLFHISSIIVLPFFLLKNIKFSRNAIIIGLLIAIIIGLSNISSFINPLIANIKYFNLFPSSDFAYHIQGLEKYSYFEGFTLMNWKGFLWRFIPLIIQCIILIPKSKDNESYNFYFNVFFITIILYGLLSTIHYGYRIVFGLMIIQTLTIPMAYYYGSHKRKINILLYVGLLIILYILYLINLKHSPIDGMIVPYKIWSN